MRTDARPTGQIKASADDFIVDEVPLYAPSGAGEHLYVHIRKRLLGTDEAAQRIARALGANPRDVGIAGLKDKVAVTTQWLSLQPPRGVSRNEFEGRVRALAIDGVTVLSAAWHANKLRTGHLVGNRFELVLRRLDPTRVLEVVAALENAGREGLPNAFGVQRFGRDGDNAERARAVLRGNAEPPRDKRRWRFLGSSLQSLLFNAVLEARVAEGTWALPLLGDVLKKRDSGAIFPCVDVETDRARAAAGELSPTGPLFGPSMRAPTGAPFELESRILQDELGDIPEERLGLLGEGARRPLKLFIGEMSVDAPIIEGDAATLRVSFSLPKGSYATTVIAAAIDVGGAEPGGTPEGDASTEAQPDS